MSLAGSRDRSCADRAPQEGEPDIQRSHSLHVPSTHESALRTAQAQVHALDARNGATRRPAVLASADIMIAAYGWVRRSERSPRGPQDLLQFPL